MCEKVLYMQNKNQNKMQSEENEQACSLPPIAQKYTHPQGATTHVPLSKSNNNYSFACDLSFKVTSIFQTFLSNMSDIMTLLHFQSVMVLESQKYLGLLFE